MYWFKPVHGRGIRDISLELLNFCRRIFQQSYYYNVCRIKHIAIDEIACLVIFILYHVVGQFIHYLIQIIIVKQKYIAENSKRNYLNTNRVKQKYIAENSKRNYLNTNRLLVVFLQINSD